MFAPRNPGLMRIEPTGPGAGDFTSQTDELHEALELVTEQLESSVRGLGWSEF